MLDHPVPLPMLRSLIYMNSVTGSMTWRPRGIPAWDARYANCPAFQTVDKNGYRRSTIFGRSYYAHRVVFALTNGRWPSGDVDHIDRDRSNNSPSNLREATRRQNCGNTSSRGGSSQYVGVSWDKAREKWVAGIRVSGKRLVLGRFDCEVQAAMAYDAAAKSSRGEFAGLNFPSSEVVS